MKPATVDASADGDDRRAHVAGALSASVMVHLVAFGVPVLSWWSPSRDLAIKPKLVAQRGEVSVVVQSAPAVAPSVRKVEVPRPKPREVESVKSIMPERVRPRPIAREITPARLRRERATERLIPREQSPRTPQTTERRVVPSEPVVLDAGVTSARLVEGVGTPRYPKECAAGKHRRGGCEGRGEYELVVDEHGRVVSARTLKSAGCPYLDRAAVLFFRHRARFEIVEKDGVPVGWRGTRKVDFSFKDRK